MRKPVVVTVPHQLGKEEAKRRLQGSTGQIRSQLAGFGASVEDQWAGDRMNFAVAVLGQNICGRIDVEEELVRVEVDLPWMLAMLAEKISGRISRQGTLMLTKD
jgi:predicted metal-dependent hydrolase